MKEYNFKEVRKEFNEYCERYNYDCDGCKYRNENGTCINNYMKDNFVIYKRGDNYMEYEQEYKQSNEDFDMVVM